jgi:hypothetical protein
METTFALEQAQELRQIVLQKLTDIETFYGITQLEECQQKMSPDEYNVYCCLHKVEGILCL